MQTVRGRRDIERRECFLTTHECPTYPSVLALMRVYDAMPQKNATAACSEGHIVNIGTLIEDMENTLRNQLDQVSDLVMHSICCY